MPNDVAILNGDGDRTKTLVVIFLRGGADGLNMVIPVGEEAYYKARPRLGIAEKDAAKLDGFFAFNPHLKDLQKIYAEGSLAIIQAAGSEDTTRSHFEAQDFMEHGGLVGGGWIGRYLRYRQTPSDGALGAVAISKSLPESLRGAPSAVVFESFDEFTVGDGRPNFASGLASLYARETDALGGAAKNTLRGMERVKALATETYQPENGAEYPADEFGRGLSRVAQLIKARVGLEVASVDLNGWDSHFVQGTIMDPLMDRLAKGLSAFHADIKNELPNVTTVAMTEFGRRVHENASFGTDHGRGSVMLLMGGGIRGGRVIADWQGLREELLEGPGDLPVTHNYRDVLAPILKRNAPDCDLGLIFPQYSLQPVELYA
jgi:uncharacterized protein (DUF1501 family)